MFPLQGWNLIIWAGAALVAVTALARLMTRRHRELETEFRAAWQAERARLAVEETKKKAALKKKVK